MEEMERPVITKTPLRNKEAIVAILDFIELDESRARVYTGIATEIIELAGGTDSHFNPIEALPFPARAVWKGKAAKKKCYVTGKIIKRGDSCVIIFSKPSIDQTECRSFLKRTVLAVLADEAALDHLLELGSLTALRDEIRTREEILPAPKAQPIFPHQNMCYCVRCGVRIVRPEGTSLYSFGKVYRCAECHESGISMTVGTGRFCRNCGVPFIATEQSHRNCPKCRTKPKPVPELVSFVPPAATSALVS